MPSLRIAWRNLWRNRRRTTISVAAVALNTCILIISSSLMQGLIIQITDNATQIITGEAQIHDPGYLQDRSLYETIPNAARLLNDLERQKIGAAPRLFGYGLVSQGSKSAGALFCGMDPRRERAAFKLAGHLQDGRFLEDQPKMGIVLGKKLARSLNVRVGAKIVVVVQAADGSLGNDLFTVTGILKAIGDKMDRSAALIHIGDFRNLFVMPKGVHEIAVNSKGRMSLGDLSMLLRHIAPQLEVKTWRDLLPTLSDMIHLSTASMTIFAAIFFLAGGLGVMNTMLMATYERIPEFGLLKALGAPPWLIVRDVITEAWLLSILATVPGALAGILTAMLLQQTGLNTAGLAGAQTTIAGIAFDPIWRASLSFAIILKSTAAMWIVCVLAALYPAMVSARLDPVKSMSHV